MVGINAQLNFVLLGKTGSGKSAAGNTILGREAFKSKKSLKSVTQGVAVASETFNGQVVTVYDTPGLFDTDLSDDEVQLIYQEVLQKCESGSCAYLLVIKADRFTKEERETVEKIEKLLGQNRMEKTWILFTRGDELEEENMTIQEFLAETEPLKNLTQKYEDRFYVFNNKKRGQTKQVQRLLSVINSHFNIKGLNIRKRSIPKHVEPDPASSRLSSTRIVLLGKTGVGKSAAGNTILGQKVFRSELKMNAVTHKCSEKHAAVSDRSVSVVDTPGFFDTKMKPQKFTEELARSVYLSSPGPHAFLIVFPVNMRYTEQEQQIPEQIEMTFGQEVLKYSTILFTHGDLLKGKAIEELIKENSALRHLVQQCGGRFHVFNNEDVNNREQVNDLLQKIDTMIEQNGGGHYSNEMFEDAQRFRLEGEKRRGLSTADQREGDESGNGFVKFLSKYWHHILIGAVVGGLLIAVLGTVAGAAVGAIVVHCGCLAFTVAESAAVGAAVGAALGLPVGAICTGAYNLKH